MEKDCRFNRRIALICASTGLSLCLGLLLPRQWAYAAFERSGYYFVFVSFCVWLFFLAGTLRRRFGGRLRKYRLGLILSVALICLVFSVAPPKFKVLSDEANLVGVSLAMYQDKTASLPIQSLQIETEPFNPQVVPNKRPLLFPFVVSVLHSLLGYSPYHGLIVNFICAVIILGLVYVFVYENYSKTYAALALVVFVSFPIFSFWVPSSGFETLNLFFVMLTFLLLHQFIKKKRPSTGELIIWTLVMLMQCRYESVIFLIGLVFLLPHIARREMIARYSIATFFAPLFLVPVLWQRKFFLNSTEPVRVGLNLLETAQEGFGVSHLIQNFHKNIFVFSGLEADFGFIAPYFVLAVCGACLFVKQCLRKSEQNRSPSNPIIMFGLVSFFLLFLIYSSYQWGDFTRSTANRFALIFLPFMTVSCVHFLSRVFKQLSGEKVIILGILATAVLVYYWPHAFNQKLVQNLSLTYEYNGAVDYIETHYTAEKDKVLVVSDRPNLYLIHSWGSITFAYANEHKDLLAHLRNTYFTHILVLQRVAVQDDRPVADNAVDPSYRLKPLTTIRSGHLTKLNLFEVTGII
jgi:hypothetical protein